MLTASGRQIDLRYMPSSKIDIFDVAHQLAQINRFTGACSRPYSVTEHSLLVAVILEQEARVTDPRVLLAGLLHDAHEAYCSDLSTPMKQLVGPAWRAEENRIQHSVLRAFGVQEHYALNWSVIHLADMKAFATEARDLLPSTALPLFELDGIAPSAMVNLNDTDAAAPWTYWRDQFLAKFAELDRRRVEMVMNSMEPLR